jgi:hypothetical protein
MTISFKALVAAAITFAASAARGDDLCYADGILPKEHPIYDLQLGAKVAQVPKATQAQLSISARAPGIAYTASAAALKPDPGYGAETEVEISFDVYSGGLAPTRIKVLVNYPVAFTEMPLVTLQGPFGVLRGKAERTDPKLGDVYAHLALTQDQLRAFVPGTQIALTINAADGTLLETGNFDVPDLPTLQTLVKAAGDQLNLLCVPQQPFFPL